MTEAVPSVPERLRTGFFAGLHTSVKLIKFVLPLWTLAPLS